MPALQEFHDSTLYLIRAETAVSRLALKIVVMALGKRQEARGKRQEGRGFGQLYFSLHITLREAASRLRFFSVHLLN